MMTMDSTNNNEQVPVCNATAIPPTVSDTVIRNKKTKVPKTGYVGSETTEGLPLENPIDDVNSGSADRQGTVDGSPAGANVVAGHGPVIYGVDGDGGDDDDELDDYRLKVLEDIVRQQKDELECCRWQLVDNEDKRLKDVESLQMQLQSVNKRYDAAKQERETTYMRYVLKEKEVLGLNTEKKKLTEGLEDRDRQIVRFKANHKEFHKFTNIIERKNKEIKDYKVMVDLLKGQKTRVSKDLENVKSKYEHDLKCLHESENKLLQEVQELQNKLESPTKEDCDLEDIVLNSRLYLDLKECSDHKLQETEKLKSTIEDLNNKLIEHTRTVNCLKNENIGLKVHTKSCEIKTNKLLVLTKSLTSRNASLQSKCKNLQTASDKLKDVSDVLKQKNIHLKTALDVQKDDINKEKQLYISDKKELANELELKMQMIDELKTALECTRNDLHVLKQKSKTTAAKQLQEKNIDITVETKCLLDKVLKLQQENSNICEKLDFVENHNKQLLCKLTEKIFTRQQYRKKTCRINMMNKHDVVSDLGGESKQCRGKGCAKSAPTLRWVTTSQEFIGGW